MKPQYDQIPEEIRSLPNWVCWRLEKRANKSGVVSETKVPYNPRTGRRAKPNDSATWSSFEEALAAFERGGYAGIGFNLTQPYVGVDLDGCRLNGAFEPEAERIIQELASYTELSPSQTGAHIVAKGELPDGRRQIDFKDREHHGVGLYDAARGRYLTMTGCRVNGTAIQERTAELRQFHARLFPPETKAKGKANPDSGGWSDDELIAKARAARNGVKFARLWDGQWEEEGEYATQSEADLALCCMLAFWTNRNPERIDRLFRRSGLMRPKWDRPDYREKTIAAAIERTSDTWKSKPRATAALVDLNRFSPSLDLLNSLSVWQGRIAFTSVKRRGPMVIATTKDAEIVWPSTADLGSFAKSQAIISDVTNIWIPTPPPP